MHPNRRRKKRPNYGIRTVEVLRGPNGFGFTISGQQPCILSCIVLNSPADQAGLRAGDFLISVNGVSVSKIPHDAVVNLIGNSVGPIKMTIAENYYSDSSDEELDISRIVNLRKPKHMHKLKMHRGYKQETHNIGHERTPSESPIKKAIKLRENNIKGQNIEVVHSNYVERPLSIDCLDYNAPSLQLEDEGGPIEFKAIVGYLGTIEMPNQLLPNNRLQTVCTCIRKLRQEKRTPTAILMTILPTCLTLKNASNNILAIYPVNRVVYISSSSDRESRYFGLVTSAICDRSSESIAKDGEACAWQNEAGEEKHNKIKETNSIDISNSCHVFMTDPKIVDHNVHVKKAQSFKVTCTTDVVTGSCLEFPRNALYIVSLVQNMYHLQDSIDYRNRPNLNNEDHLVANSPQPSASSNSDSGIGFRDDCGNVSDRILVVEFPSHRPLPLICSNNNRPSGIDASNIVLENLDIPLNNENSQVHSFNNVKTNNFEFVRPNDLSKNLNGNANYERTQEEKCTNLNNIRAYDNVTSKPHSIFDKQSECVEPVYKQNFEAASRLAVRAMPYLKVQNSHILNEESYRTGDIDSGQIYSERPIDVPTASSPTKKSFENVSLNFDDFKTSVDNVSVHSSKSLELKYVSSLFKTPSTKFFGKKTSKRNTKLVSSCDNLVSDKLSPKVYGVSKPNYSCEELNTFDSVDTCTGYGSLQDLYTIADYNENKRNIAQSEPDVRIQSRNKDIDLVSLLIYYTKMVV